MNRMLFLSILVIPGIFPFQTQAQRKKMLQQYLEKSLDRDAAPNTGPVPDYNDLFFWAASPYKHDASDRIPAFLKKEKQEDSGVDVFFIHPTSFIGMSNEEGILEPGADRLNILKELKPVSWNADLTDTTVNNRTDFRTILYQATVFNGSCRVFAPRYRQANIKAFFIRNFPVAQKALDLAYSDVRSAFEYYLKNENNGRPIIIASHSQGSLHAIRLLKEFFDGKPLQQKLVCAYIVGYQIPEDAFKHIPVGDSAEATSCFVGWRSFQKGEINSQIKEEKGNSVCVNPLTWTTSTQWAPASMNAGSLFGFNTLNSHAASAGIEPDSKILWVSFPKEAGEYVKRLKNLHVYDYNLFWMNIRENVKQRIDAYFRKTNNQI